MAATKVFKLIDAAVADTSATVDTTNYSQALVHVYSAAGCTATVAFSTSSIVGTPDVTLQTIVNPDATGQIWVGTPGQRLTATISGRSAGTITVAVVLR